MRNLYLFLTLALLTSCKSGGDAQELTEQEISEAFQVEPGQSFSEAVCNKFLAYNCDTRLYEIGGFITVSCAGDDVYDFMNDDDEKLAAVMEKAELIKSDLDTIGVTFSEDLSYDEDTRDDGTMDSKVIDSANGNQVHIALDWTNEAIKHSTGNGPLSKQGLFIQIQDEDLLEGLEGCAE